MNKLQLLKNDWIKNKSLKISKVVGARRINSPSDGTAYNELMAFDLSELRAHNGLYQMFIKVSDISFEPVFTTAYKNYFAYLIKKIRLRTKRDTTLMEYDYRYTLKKISEKDGTYFADAYNDLTNFSNTTQTAYVPIFSFFGQENPLDLRKMEALELLVETNDLTNVFPSGLPAPNEFLKLKSAKFELLCMFQDTPEKDPLMNIGDLTLYNPLSTKLESTYDIFYEPTVSINSNKARILLECPYPVMSIHALAQGAFMNQFGVITNAKLIAADETIFDLDVRVLRLEGPNTENTFASFQFLAGSDSDSGAIHFADSFFPGYLELELDPGSPPFEGSITVFYEYMSELEVKDARIQRNSTGTFKIR